MLTHLRVSIPDKLEQHQDWDIISDSVYRTVVLLSEGCSDVSHELVEAAVSEVLEMTDYSEDYSEQDKHDIAGLVLDVFDKPVNRPVGRFISSLGDYPSLTYLTSSKTSLSFLLETNEDVC